MNAEMNMGRDLAFLVPQITVVLTAVAALVGEMLRRPRISRLATIAGLAVATLLAAHLLGTDTTVFQGTYRIDNLSVWAVIILAPSTLLSVLLAVPEVRGTDREGTVYALLAFTTVGALTLAGAGDVMFLVLGVLLSSLGSFALVAYPRDDRATEAAMKYFVFGSVTGAVMTYGLTFWYGATGSTLLRGVGRLGDSRLALTAGLAGMLVGLGYKAALAPFHFWAPDAYDGGPLSVAAYLSVVPKIGAIFALAQIIPAVRVASPGLPTVIALVSVLSMTYGNLAALSQTNVVRLLAYSSIAQAGYFLLGVVAMGTGILAVQSLVVFGSAYATMNLGAFAVVARVGRDLTAFTGIGRQSPWLGAGVVIFLLSLVGVPPLGGFAGKLLLFGAAINGGFTWLAVAAIANSVLSLAVYLRVVFPLYQEDHALPGASRPTQVVLVITMVLTVLVGAGAQFLLAQVN